MNTRVSDNQERRLQEIAKRAERPRDGAGFSLATDFTLIDCYGEEEFVVFSQRGTFRLLPLFGDGPIWRMELAVPAVWSDTTAAVRSQK